MFCRLRTAGARFHEFQDGASLSVMRQPPFIRSMRACEKMSRSGTSEPSVGCVRPIRYRWSPRVPSPPTALAPITGRWTSGTAGRWAPIINLGMSSPDSGGCRLPPITPIDDAAADPTADGNHHDNHHHRHVIRQHSIAIATRRYPPHQGCCRFRPGFSFDAVLWPDAQSPRSSYRGNKWASYPAR